MRRAVALVREHCRWEHAGQPFFSGEVEPCINGRTENYLVSNHPGFVELIRTSREKCPPGAGIPLDEIERKLAANVRRPPRRGKTTQRRSR